MAATPPLWLRTLRFTLLVPGTVVGLAPALLLGLLPDLLRWEPGTGGRLGLLLIALGGAGYLWCAWDFVASGRGTPAPWDAPRQLVVRGLYRVSRNPMYLSLVLLLAGEAAWAGSGVLVGYAVAVWSAFHLRVVRYEEPVLRQAFGDAFARYCARVPRWLGRRG